MLTPCKNTNTQYFFANNVTLFANTYCVLVFLLTTALCISYLYLYLYLYLYMQYRYLKHLCRQCVTGRG